jgi:hypothetical protein
MHPIVGFIKGRQIGSSILLGIVAGAGLLYLVFRDPIYLYAVACYFAIFGGFLTFLVAMKNSRGKS